MRKHLLNVTDVYIFIPNECPEYDKLSDGEVPVTGALGNVEYPPLPLLLGPL